MCRSAEAFESKDKTLSSLARFQEVLLLLLLTITTLSHPLVLHREEDQLSALS